MPEAGDVLRMLLQGKPEGRIKAAVQLEDKEYKRIVAAIAKAGREPYFRGNGTRPAHVSAPFFTRRWHQECDLAFSIAMRREGYQLCDAVEQGR